MFNSKSCCFLILFLISSNLIFSQTIKGKITDAKTGEPMVGATVSLEHTKFTTAVNLDGSYTLKNIPAGKYELVIKTIGYKTIENINITISTNEVIIKNVLLESDVKELSSVTVVGGGRETDRAVRGLEKKSDVVQNVLSQKAIELSPDVTVANSLQRISGVSIERSGSGEGRYAIIRGMDQRYNNTLVNGVKIPSPDDKFRYVPLDLFPSDLLERLEVVKSLTPNMEADAVGGSMNLVMKSAPNKLLLNANAAGGYSTLFSSSRPFSSFDNSYINKKDPAEMNGSSYVATAKDFPSGNLNFTPHNQPINSQLGLTVGGRFAKDKKLGVILGASFQNTYRGSNSIFNQQAAAPVFRRNLGGIIGNDYNNSSTFSDSYIRQYSTQQQRIGINNKWDYVFNDNNKISLFNLYVHMNDFQSRYSIDSVLGPNKGNVKEFYRSRWQEQSIYNSTLQGNHNLSALLKLNWSAVYSHANQKVPDQAEYEVDNTVNVVPKKYTLNDMTRTWSHNTDQDLAGYLNFIYTPKIHHSNVELSAGGLYRHKWRDNYYNQYKLSPVGGAPVFTNINDAQYYFASTDAGKGQPGNGSTYTVTENISAGYIQAKFMATPNLQVLGGARVEHTDENYQSQLDPHYYAASTGHIYYTDFLPSLHFKYLLSAKENLRLSYFRSLVRPGFFEVTPYYIEQEYYYIQGNPYLKHTTANNIDLRYEFFPNGADQFLVGGFYKGLHNPIETVFPQHVQAGQQIALSPANLGDATNLGIELVATKYFGKFGVNANYTYTHSSITTLRNYLYYDSTGTGGSAIKQISQTRPLQGQAKHIGNISLLFKDPKIGLDIQLAYVYTGERIVQVAQYYGLDSWQDPYSQLDFSFEKRLAKHISIYAKVNNLTNSKTNVVIKQPYVLDQGSGALDQIAGQTDHNRIFVQSDLYKISFLFGGRYKF